MRFRGFPFVATLALFGASALAVAEELPLGAGVQMPPGSRVTTGLKNLRDTDYYVFAGYPGQVIGAALRVQRRRTELNAEIALIRPDGTEVLFDARGRAIELTEVIGPDGEPRIDEDTGLPLVVETVIRGGRARLARPVSASRLVRLDDGMGGVTLDYADQSVRPVVRIRYIADQVGTYTVVVRPLDQDPDVNLPVGDPGEYTVAIGYGRVRPTRMRQPEPVGDEFAFDIPATGGARLNFAFVFRGPAPVFRSLTAPGGADVTIPRLITRRNRIVARNVPIDAALPQGTYRLAFDPPVDGSVDDVRTRAFVAGVRLPPVRLPSRARRRTGRLSADEPVIINDGVDPLIGGPRVGSDPGTTIVVTALNAFDDNQPYDAGTDFPDAPFVRGKPRLFVGGLELENVEVLDAQAGRISGEVPPGLPEGTFRVTLETGAGQVAVSTVRGDEGQVLTYDVFTRVPPPQIDSIDPLVGTENGGFLITFRGTNFRPAPAGSSKNMRVLLGQGAFPSDVADAPIISETETEVVIQAPARAPGNYTFGLLDGTSNLRDLLPIDSFTYLAGPGISRITPRLLPAIPGESDTIFVKGDNFKPTDVVRMENEAGGFDTIASTQTSKLHSFPAPMRAVGTYEIFVEDHEIDPPQRTSGFFTVSYFSYEDFTAEAGLNAISSTDPLDAWDTTIADMNQDGAPDLVMSRVGSSQLSTSSQTRVFHNDGAGSFVDVTASVMPPTEPDDDWRADGVEAVDLNRDGFPDIAIVTDSMMFPAASKSHVRLLMSERRTGGAVDDRVYRNRTAQLMAPPRSGKSGVSNSSGDNWRGLAMWVGDIDRGPPGPPEILITHNELSQEIDVTCGNYCSSAIGGALYRFYWPAARAFFWDAYARGGQGQFRFDPNFFVRASGVLVPIGNPPPGAKIRPCNNNTPCAGTFIPFKGHSIAVGDINGDLKPDVVTLTNDVVMVDDKLTSSTQVGLNIFDTEKGSALTDVSNLLQDIGGDTKGESVAIVRLGYPDGNSYGTIVVGQDEDQGTYSLRMWNFQTPLEGEVAAFEEISALVLPSPFPDGWQASAIGSVDVDGDGDQDVILVAKAPPGGGPALRILRNDGTGTLTNELEPLVAPLTMGADKLDGTSLAIGDLDDDGTPEFVITRSAPGGGASQTRIIRTDIGN